MPRGMDYKELKALCDDPQYGYDQTVNMLSESFAEGHMSIKDFSLREAAETFMGNEWMAQLNPKSGRIPSLRQLRESAADAVAFAQFSGITGQIFFDSVLQATTREELVFSKLVETKPSSILDMERIPGMSDIGDEFTTVGENDEYPFVGFSEDFIDIAEKKKRGARVGVTKEMIRGDKTGLLADRADGLGWFLGLNKEKRIIDAVIDENGGATSAVNGGHRYHWKGTSYASYQTTSPWINVATSNGLAGVDNIDTAFKLINNMVDPYTGEPIIIIPKHIVVTSDRYHKAKGVVRAQEVRYNTNANAGTATTESVGPNPLDDYDIIFSRLLKARAATDTDWWYGDVRQAVKYFSIWDNENESLGANSEAAFARDIIMQFKCSEMGAAAVVQPRALIENRE